MPATGSNQVASATVRLAITVPLTHFPFTSNDTFDMKSSWVLPWLPVLSEKSA
jgi:hypothetical protein